MENKYLYVFANVQVIQHHIKECFKWQLIGMRKEEVRAIHLHTQKVRVSKLNTYKTFAYAVTYLKMLSTAQKLHRTNRQYVKYNLRFYFCFCFWKNLLHPPPNPPLLSLSYCPSISVTVTTQIKQLSTDM